MTTTTFVTPAIQERWYQAEAVEYTYDFIRRKAGNPCVVLPTAAGKSVVIARFCRDAVIQWGGRVLVLTHVKELVEQNAAKIQALCPTVSVGVYSAGLKSRDTSQPIIVAGVQSVYDKAELLGEFDIVIIDEAHLIPPVGDGMYQELIAGLVEINPNIRIIGLTATPYRLGSGSLCSEDGVLNEICYEVGIKPLIQQGYLAKLVGKNGTNSINSAVLKVVRGEFDDKQTEDAFATVLEAATREIIEKTLNRRSVLIFCQNKDQAKRVAEILRDTQRGIFKKGAEELGAARSLFDVTPDPVSNHFDNLVAADWLEERDYPVDNLRFCLNSLFSVGEIYGDTKPERRAEMVAAFRDGSLKYLVNVNVLTTGFDAPNTDTVCLMRASVSPGLVYQICGRGFRVYPGKSECVILDYGENLLRHGPVDLIRPREKKARGEAVELPAKSCPTCQTVTAAGSTNCPECGYAYPMPVREPSRNVNAKADDADPISQPTKVEEKAVTKVTYQVHTKKGAEPGTPQTLRVIYHTDMVHSISEWICVEHEAGGFAHRKAQRWWFARCRHPMPATAVQAVQFAAHGLLANCTSITTTTKPGEKFPNVTGHTLVEKPRGTTPCPGCGFRNKRVIVPADDGGRPGKILCGACGHFFDWADRDAVNFYGFYTATDGDVEAYLGLLGMRVDEEQRAEVPEAGEEEKGVENDWYDELTGEDSPPDDGIPF